MTVPMLGTLTVSGFVHKWYFLFLLVVLGLVGLYVGVQLSRHKRMLRFANMELLDSVCAQPAEPVAAPGGDPAGVFAGAADRRDGRTDP